MSDEKGAFERLIVLRVLSPDSHFSPSRAHEGWYSAMLRTELKRIDQPTVKKKQSGLLLKLSTADLLAQIDNEADRLLLPTSAVPAADRIIHLRELARDLGLILRDTDLQRRIWEARRRASGAVQMIQPGVAVSAPATVWAWENVLMQADTNLLVSVPKAGKTTLIIGAIAAWHYGQTQYLGQAFNGPCPAVVIIGVDMPRSRWMPLLGRFGLAEQLDDQHWRLLPEGPIKGLFSQTEPVHLDAEGLSRIAEVASHYKGCLLLADSYAKLTGPLGLREGDSSFAGPLGDLQEAVSPFETTLVVIHHAGHTRKGEGAVAASRGTTALPAAVSQVIGLSWFNRSQSKADKRLLLETEGRGGEPLQLLIQQHATGWDCLGDAESALRQQAKQAAEDRLTDTQSEVLELVRMRAESGNKTNYRIVREHLKIADRQALRTLRALEQKGFLRASHEASDIGSSIWFLPS
jgi:hypothetical protein